MISGLISCRWSAGGSKVERLKYTELALEIKFGEAGSALITEIRPIEDLDLLRKIKEALRTAGNLEEIRPPYREATH